MSEPAYSNELTLLEAVNQLSLVSEFDLHTTKIPPGDRELSRIRSAFTRLNGYLHYLYTKNREELKSRETQRGIQSMMHLAKEASSKLEKVQNLFQGSLSAPLREYQELEELYRSKIIHQIRGVEEKTEGWEAAFQEETETGLHLLKNLESISSDRHYELFLLQKEDHTPFFSHALLHQLRLSVRQAALDIRCFALLCARKLGSPCSSLESLLLIFQDCRDLLPGKGPLSLR